MFFYANLYLRLYTNENFANGSDSGKTYLSERLVPLVDAAWYNTDVVCKMANDWDFSDDGRSR